jgi:hypothetical protein
VLVPLDRDGNTPLYVSRHWALLQSGFEVVANKVLDIRAPVIPGIDEREYPLFEGWEIEVEMLGFANDRRRSAQFAPRVNQIDGVERAPAVITLVAAGVRESAVGTRPLDIPIREKAIIDLAEELLARLQRNMTVIVEVAKDLLRDAEVILSVRVGE